MEYKVIFYFVLICVLNCIQMSMLPIFFFLLMVHSPAYCPVDCQEMSR